MNSTYDAIFKNSEVLERTVMFSKIAGITFYNRQALAAKCYNGMALYLRREADNPYDSNAVAVCMNSGHQFGFIPKETAKTIAKMLDNGMHLNCYVEKVNITPTGTIGINIRITEKRG